MKTIIDVVNYFQAEWPAAGKTTVYDNILLNGYHFGGCITNDTICTAKEFNSLITELSNWQPTLPKVETVECKGKIYEIGKYYEFSYDCEFNRYEVHKLIGFDPKQSHFETELSFYANCRKLTSDAGTITPAPTKLIDNNIYTFELNCDLWSGFYRESRGSFFTQLVGGNKICSTSEASKITHLTEAK